LFGVGINIGHVKFALREASSFEFQLLARPPTTIVISASRNVAMMKAMQALSIRKSTGERAP
jgi:hypothetical protein